MSKTTNGGRSLIPFGPINGIEYVTMHAMNRFRERSGVTGTAGEVLHRMEQWVKRARPAELKPGKVLVKLLNNGCRPATYWLFGSPRKGQGFILVVEDGTLVTVHRNASGEWRVSEQKKDKPSKQ